jgi:hypothetical protein
MLPTQFPITVYTMNWSSVILMIAVLIATALWKFHGQYHFRGPPRYKSGFECEGDTATTTLR